MKRIAYVAWQFPGVTETFMLREVTEMERRGFVVSLYSIRLRPTCGLAHMAATVSLAVRRPVGVMRGLLFMWHDCVLHARYPMDIVKNMFALPRMFLFTRQMEREQVAHIHAHFANFPTTTAAFAANVLGIGYSFTAHGSDIFTPPNQAGLAEKIHDAVFVATCTGFNAQLLRRLCRPGDHGRIMLNHHGVALSLCQPAASRETNRIISGGSLVEQKGLSYLVDAAALLRDRAPDFSIEIVGDGPLRDVLAQQIETLELSRHVFLVGSMPHEELMERMRTAAMVVVPSVETRDGLMDGIPNMLIESLALAVPVVSTQLSGIPELVVDGETGVLVEPGDADALAVALESLLRDPARGTRMGQAGRARVEKMFDLDRNVAALVERFEEILGGRETTNEAATPR